MDRKINIVVAWNKLPMYGAVVLKFARKKLNNNFPIISTKSSMPIKEVEEYLDSNFFTVKNNEETSWANLGLKIPKIFIHSGWGYKHFNSLAYEVKKEGGQVVGMFDNNLKWNFRQIIGIFYFRFFLKNRFDGVFVPGIEGVNLARILGFKYDNIFKYLYTADDGIFSCRVNIVERPKTFIFIGQLIKRKGIEELINAFNKFSKINDDWTLKIIGHGELLGLKKNKRISIEPFSPPNYLANSLNNSRVLILPSYEEHWGVVTHEAALCGCGLILTKNVGAATDLASYENSILINRTSEELIFDAMKKISNYSEDQFIAMQNRSIEISKEFNKENWTDALMKIIKKYS